MIRLRMLLITLITFSTVAFALPQAGTKILMRGHLVVPGVNYIDQIEIRLLNPSGVIVSRAYTNSQGDFELTGYLGTYFVESTLNGYEPIRERVDLVTTASGSAAIMSLAFERKEVVNGHVEDLDAVDRTQWPKPVLKEYDKALEDIRKGNRASAKTRLEGLLKLVPEFYNAHNALGVLYQEEKRLSDAESEYRRARDLNPSSIQTLINLGSVNLELADARSGQGPDVVRPLVEAAAGFLQEAVRLNPRSAPAFALLGSLAYRNGNLAVAEEDLSHALQIDAHLGSAQLTLANVYTRSQKWEATLRLLDDYLVDNPKASNREQIQQARARVVQNIQAAGK